jgi:hypothetical protein
MAVAIATAYCNANIVTLRASGMNCPNGSPSRFVCPRRAIGGRGKAPTRQTRRGLADARSQRFLNHVWLFWLPWGSGLTIPNQQRRGRFNGATPFLPHGSTPWTSLMVPAIGVLQNCARNSNSAKIAPSAVFRTGALSFGLWCIPLGGPDSGIGAAPPIAAPWGVLRRLRGSVKPPPLEPWPSLSSISGGTLARHSPRVHTKLMQEREITPHVWAHPDVDQSA